MDAHTLIAEWETSPFDGGFAGVSDLQSRRFSGAVESGGTWLFLRDGDPVAVVEDLEGSPHPGDVDAFDGASGETHEAPHPAAATLAAMLALDGEVRGQYFTDETPMSTVHETLADGGFTGYVELSENVLSGDYYVVYEDGEATYLGVLGSSNRLVTEEEAESKAESEVGIYSVVAVSLPEVELPGGGSESVESAGVAGGGAGEPSTGDDDQPDDPDTGDQQGDHASPDDADDAETTGGPADTTTTGASADESTAGDADEGASQSSADAQSADLDAGTGVDADRSGSTETERDVDESPDGTPSTASPTESDSDNTGTSLTDEPTTSTSQTPTTAERSSSDAVMDDVTTRSVPSLDPQNTARAGSEPAESSKASPSGGKPERDDQEAREDRQGRGTVEGLQEKYESRIDELQSELDAIRNERDELEDRVTSLESSGRATGGGSGGTAMTRATALDGTSLFVREGSRGSATLEDAHAGRTNREELAENLRIEHHTTFDADGATVDGEPFEAWLESSVPYAFAEWLVTDLLFEIRSTGSMSSMRRLYDALPDVDRIGFADAVTVGDGQDGRELSFDVVARNRMGDPIAVANIDDRRDPAQADRLEPIIDDASDICMEYDSLAGAFAVTSSYFEPDALSAAREATSGSLLSREKYRSYVKLSRTSGFHLCLVESRNGSFHLTVPEL